MEDKMISRNLSTAFLVILVVAVLPSLALSQNLKLGYVHSAKLLADYKKAQDAKKKLDDIYRQWETEGIEMQEKLQQLREQFNAQSLLLSEAKKKEKEGEFQTLYLQLINFQRNKLDPQQGEILEKQAELIQPILDEINNVIKKIGEEEQFDYIFDLANGSILYASKEQPDLTERVLADLYKGQTDRTESKGKSK